MKTNTRKQDAFKFSQDIYSLLFLMCFNSLFTPEHTFKVGVSEFKGAWPQQVSAEAQTSLVKAADPRSFSFPSKDPDLSFRFACSHTVCVRVRSLPTRTRSLEMTWFDVPRPLCVGRIRCWTGTCATARGGKHLLPPRRKAVTRVQGCQVGNPNRKSNGVYFWGKLSNIR